MAALPENSTNRLFVEYNTKGQKHELLFRGKPGVLVSALVAIAQDFWDQLLPTLYNSTQISAARYSSAGSEFSLPVAYAPQTGTFNGAQPDERLPYFISFTGIGTATGRRTTYRVFGSTISPDGTYRVEPPIGITLSQALGSLQAAAADLCTIGGDTISFKPYVNTGVDAYYQRKRRTG